MGDKMQSGTFPVGLTRAKSYSAMIFLQFGFAGMYVITMFSLQQGMNHYILAVYRHLVATIVIAPFALVLERKIRPKLTLPVFLRILVLGFLEPVIDQNVYYLGMKYTTATLASATVNVLPAITFVMALIFRLERVNLKKVHSIAKIIGTVIMVPGAVIMTLYKGPAINFIKLQGGGHHGATNAAEAKHWVAGTLMLLARCWGWSGFYILQSFTLRMYPAELSLTALICFIGTIGGAAVSFAVERDMNAWKIGWDASLLAAVYSGVVCSGIAYYAQGVVLREQGPVFVTAFSPLCMIITAALGSFLLAEKVHLGSIIGTVIIICGLYTVLWGKSKDQQNSTTDEGKLQELPITDSAKSIDIEDSIEGPARILKIPTENPATRET
ncbi:PREDICTED: WAT1-related protein At1g21890 [Theobroma cacao]|uniref:WAT1-related protein n=2 Tax=Theobroma cacao TaxID=3641 RepID=A0AB32UVH4_THECC|nr:PREDICTED: WAT1-related protein At1g21890 [Theobroma cacao]EOY16255.1 Nodulin MtN21 /EamA-like transporter family protein, putative [Theobroma cacao]